MEVEVVMGLTGYMEIHSCTIKVLENQGHYIRF